MIPQPDVPACVTQVYPDDAGRWWRYCLTCDDGSNKYGRHTRGHRTEADARMSARDHARAAYRVRRYRAWKAEWVKALVAAQTWDEFVSVARQMPHWRRVDFDAMTPNPQMMADIQNIYRKGK
jgi:hypothetical protein